jgi:hypothetical protein
MIESYGNKVPWSNIAEQRRAEIEACPEFVRVYIMGLEAAQLRAQANALIVNRTDAFSI